ncbi:MAG TPA: SDR family oxidoreductase [Candidatus Binataceae bacterium]|nr:SDR family oxidoreductase [Candidatus Binataceae bacterium]
MGRVSNKVAVITGAASGMGQATAIRFAGEGAAVVVADLNQEGGESTVRQCREQGGRAVFHKTDVSSEENIKSMIDRAVSEFGRLDITFNNAGLVGMLGSIEEVTAEGWDKTHAILLRGVFLGMKYSVAPMRKAGGGSIISTASIAGMRGGFGPLAYSAAKAGVISLTECAAAELGKDRIRVNCICPGGINTPIMGRPTAESEASLSRAQPIGRAGHPEDIANMALFLASDESEWITGTSMLIDGGFMARSNTFGDMNTAAWHARGRYVGPSFERRTGK